MHSVKLENGTIPFLSCVGAKQGCNRTPIFFKKILNDIPSILIKHQLVKLGKVDLNWLQYADDSYLLSEWQAELQSAYLG